MCKSPVELDQVVPIYGRGGTSMEDLTASDVSSGSGPDQGAPSSPRQKQQLAIPPRPAAHHIARAAAAAAASAQQAGANPLLLPPPTAAAVAAAAGYQLPTQPGFGHHGLPTPDQQDQTLVSKLLLMLGSFVVSG